MKSIQILRKQAEFTQQQLADKIGVERSYISKIENGVVPLTDAVLQMKLSEALGVPLSEISPEKCNNRFPAAVHGKLVYSISGYYDAIKENAKRCEVCKREFEEIINSTMKTLQESAYWTYLIHLTPEKRKALKNAFETGEGKEEWIRDWNRFLDYLRENWESLAPKMANKTLVYVEKRDWAIGPDRAEEECVR